MAQFPKWMLITSGIVAIGIVCLMASFRPEPLPDDLMFLNELGEKESNIVVYRTFVSSTRVDEVGFMQDNYVIKEQSGYVRDRILNELIGKGWKREESSDKNNLFLTKPLPNSGGQLEVMCVTEKSGWPTVTVQDDRRQLPKWRVWLHYLLN